MKLNGEAKFFIGVIVATIAGIALAVTLMSKPVEALPRETLLPPTTYTKGNPTAQVYLVEFSDFQCPACAAAKPVVDALVEKYKDQIVFGYRHFPLQQHQYAEKAAIAAEAAGAQGKFWEMYDKMFTNQAALSDEMVTTFATELELDMDAFTEALQDAKHKNRVLDDVAYGTSVGVNATPTFYLNGMKMNLLNFGDLEAEIQKALGK